MQPTYFKDPDVHSDSTELDSKFPDDRHSVLSFGLSRGTTNFLSVPVTATYSKNPDSIFQRPFCSQRGNRKALSSIRNFQSIGIPPFIQFVKRTTTFLSVSETVPRSNPQIKLRGRASTAKDSLSSPIYLF
ncbi:hypothetical protein CEXT_717801 [Caerostris extrusa]|uniref:Uncharacterized protein n=1 Tax=Caerostris extrusa TaxID=172846 RepID=A0AAV4SZX1_CAEEX|nr:hypothetical protein CEXT_717801 [Caerostris extrusa]